MKRFLSSVALVLSISALAPRLAKAATMAPETPGETIERIVRLSHESERLDSDCAAFMDSLREKILDSEKTEFFASRSSALAALKSIDRYPGTPLATGEALEAFLTLRDLPAGRDAIGLRYALARLGNCHSAEFYGVLTRLIDPRTRRFLTFSESRKLDQYLLSYVRRESESGPRFFFQMDELASVLEAAMHTRLLPASTLTRGAVSDLVWSIAKVKREKYERFVALEEALSTASPEEAADAQRALVEFRWELEAADDYRMGVQEVLEYELRDLLDAPKEIPTRPAPSPAVPPGDQRIVKSRL